MMLLSCCITTPEPALAVVFQFCGRISTCNHPDTNRQMQNLKKEKGKRQKGGEKKGFREENKKERGRRENRREGHVAVRESNTLA